MPLYGFGAYSFEVLDQDLKNASIGVVKSGPDCAIMAEQCDAHLIASVGDTSKARLKVWASVLSDPSITYTVFVSGVLDRPNDPTNVSIKVQVTEFQQPVGATVCIPTGST